MKSLLVLLPTIILADEAFYANRAMQPSLIDKIRFNEYQGPEKVGCYHVLYTYFKDQHANVDASEILGSFMNPFMEMYDSMQQNYKARQYAERVQKEKDEVALIQRAKVEGFCRTR